MATSVADAVPLAPDRSGHNGRVIHVRIVSTPELLEPMLRRVEADDAVVNIVVVEGVCRRPYGHLVLLDVTEEAAHQLLDALEQLGLTESGSVALEHAPFTVSRAAEQAEAGAPGHPEEAVIWDEVLVRARSDATLTLSLVVFMVIAAVIAAVGILTDSPILIVGAMVVSPDFNPISALTVALFLGQRRLAGRAAATLAWGFLFAVAATMVLTFVVEAIDRVPEVFAFDERILTSFISRPNGFSAVVALMAGTAGALSHHGVEGRHAGRGVHLRHDHPGGRRHGRAPGGRQLGTGLGSDPSARDQHLVPGPGRLDHHVGAAPAPGAGGSRFRLTWPAGAAAQVSFSTKDSSWRRFRHS